MIYSVLTEGHDAVAGKFLDTQADAREEDALLNNNIRDLIQCKTCGYRILPGSQDHGRFLLRMSGESWLTTI